MKTIIKISFVALLFLMTTACRSKHAMICVSIDKNMGITAPWAYLYAFYGNQVEILDSCQIKEGQFRFAALLPHEEDMVELLIPDVTNYSIIMAIARGENVKLQIDSTTRMFFPQSEGSYATTRMTEISKRFREIGYSHLDSLKGLLATLPTDDPCRRNIADTLAAHEQEMNALAREAVTNERSSLLAILATIWYVQYNPKVSADSMSCVVKNISMRFPDAAWLTAIDTERHADPPTPESIRTINRKAQLKGEPRPYPAGNDDEASAEEDYPAYKLGEKVNNLTLPNLNGKDVRLSAISSDYILIDFWASWCAPCQDQIPHIVATEKQYRDVLTIYAVSLDSRGELWEKAVEKLGMQNFVNVRLSQDYHGFKSLADRFDLQTIPRNILLDKDHKIIAFNLMGEALSEKMEELITK